MITKICNSSCLCGGPAKSKSILDRKSRVDLIRETPMSPGGSWLEVAPKGAETALVIYPKSMMKNWAELKPSIVFVCDDIQATYKQMQENGIQFDGEPKEMQWGTFATFKDEEGYTYVLKG